MYSTNFTGMVSPVVLMLYGIFTHWIVIYNFNWQSPKHKINMSLFFEIPDDPFFEFVGFYS